MGEDTKARIGEHPLGDAGQLTALVLFVVVWVGDSFFLKQTTFLSIHVPFALLRFECFDVLARVLVSRGADLRILRLHLTPLTK